jgi:hypothetical protein
MIPQLDSNGNLPPGVWTATMSEIKAHFTGNEIRSRLFKELEKVLEVLKDANCMEAFLNGSFVTKTLEPGDYDLCYEPTGLEPREALRQLLELSAAERKKKHSGDIFIRFPSPPFFFDHVESWQTDREGNAKGILRIELRTND